MLFCFNILKWCRLTRHTLSGLDACTRIQTRRYTTVRSRGQGRSSFMPARSPVRVIEGNVQDDFLSSIYVSLVEDIVMFSSTSGDEVSDLATYLLTDLHQPQTVNLLTTPVPRCPEDPNIRNVEAWDDLSEPVEASDVPEGTIQEVLKLLERVDLSFMKRRRGFTKVPDKVNMTPLMVVFEDRSPRIFDPCGNEENSHETGGKRPQAEVVANDVRTPKVRKTKARVGRDNEKNPLSESGNLKVRPRVSLKESTTLNAGAVANTLNKEEEEQKASESMKSTFTQHKNKFSDIEFHDKMPVKIWKDIHVLSSDVLRMSSQANAFKELSNDFLLPIIDTMIEIVAKGSGILLKESQSDKSDDYYRVLAALEAIVVIQRMFELASNTMVISEERLDLCIEVTRFHLHNNVLPFYDARIRMSTRPDIPEMGNGKKSGADGRHGRKSMVPKAIEDVNDRILISLDLISNIVGSRKVQIPSITPLIRTAIQSMTVDRLPEIQSKSVKLLSSVYFSYPDLRHSMFHDVFVALTPYLGVGRKCKRDIQVSLGNAGMKSVNVMTTLILHIVQTCAQLPKTPSIQAIKDAYSTCIKAADCFWELCMERVGSAKTMRLETDADFPSAMMGIVQDILELSSSTFWPCASPVLIRLVSMINGPMGLQNQDSLVRQICVDIIGKILSHVHKDSIILNDHSQRFEEIIHDTDYENISEAVWDLLFSCLSTSDGENASAAGQFLCLQKLCEEQARLEETFEESEEHENEFSKIYFATLDKLNQHAPTLHGDSFSDAEAVLLMKVFVHEQFLSAAPAMLSWLLEILQSKTQSSSIRSKVVRSLGDVIAVDKRLLDVTSMLAAIEHALQDDSISVREAALVLVGKHMIQDSSLAMQLLNIVIKATDDPGSSVRRSAIRILRDCALVIPSEHHNKAIDAYKAILNRSTDSEESVKSSVVKIFKSLWFDATIEGEDGVKVTRSASDRAQSLAGLANAIITCVPSSSSGIRSLLEKSNPLVVLLSSIYEDTKLDGHKDKTTKEEYLDTSTALLDAFIYSKDGKLPYLYAIYSMVLSNPSSCIPESDPMKFLRAMAPEIKTLSNVGLGSSRATEGAEESLYVLAIISNLLMSMEHDRTIVMDLATEISEELPNVINTHKFTVIVSAACACLSACALSSPTATGRFLNIAAQYLSFLETPKVHAKNLPRFIFIVGQVYRHGARLLQQVDLYLPDQPILAQKLRSESCIKLLLGFWDIDLEGSPALAAQVQRTSLEAVCQVMISCPWLALDGNCGVQKVISEALLLKAPPLVRLAALNGLIEILEADAHALSQRQSIDSRGVEATPNRISISKPAVAAENGDGENSHGGAILQNHWEAILSLATECPQSLSNGEQIYVTIKRRILSLVEIAVRDGLVGPWTAVPTLVLLTMDAHAGQDICARSIKLLKLLETKYPQYVDAGRLVKGVKDAYIVYIKDALKKVRDTATMVIPEGIKLTQGRLRRLYLDIVNTSRSKRNEFLRLLIRAFKNEFVSRKDGANRRTSVRSDEGHYPPSMWPCLALLIAAIPFTKSEEVCITLHEIDAIIAYKLPSTVAELHEFIESDTPVNHPAVKQCASRAKLLSVLVRLKRYLMKAYAISPERQAVYSASRKRSLGGTSKQSSDGLFTEAVHFNAKMANSGDFGLYEVFSFRQDLDTSQIVPSILHPLSQGPLTTPLVDLKELFQELDRANEGSLGDNFVPSS